jgi:YD repeat-containing protein
VLDADTPFARFVEDGILTTNCGFDGAGRLAGVTDPNGNALAFTWGRSGVEAKETAARQRTEYTRDADGRLARATSRFADAKTADRAVAYAYDRLDRIVSADYGGGQVETMTYDSWGRMTEASSCGSKASLKKTDSYIQNKLDAAGITYTEWRTNPTIWELKSVSFAYGGGGVGNGKILEEATQIWIIKAYYE